MDLDTETKAKVVTNGVTNLGLPLLRAALDHRYRMKEIDRREEMAVNVAERKAKSAKALAEAKQGNMEAAQEAARGREEPVGGSSSSDVYDALESFKHETECQFCRGVADALMNAPPAEARDGLEELRAYNREQERIENQDVDQQEAEEIVDDVVSRWEVVPNYAMEAL